VQARLKKQLEFELTGGPYAVTAARLALSDLDELVDEGLAFDIRLLVSELVTNSVRHAQIGPEGSITLRVAVGDENVRVEVVDEGPGFEAPKQEPTTEDAREAGSGWGLFFVDQLADSWATDPSSGRVWFEIQRDRGEADRGQTAA
jgi:anti-sigma regulatory factor (Ser/Thr protein kinase)